MAEMTSYPDGVFNWVDLTTTDVAGAKAFYGGLFGWTAEDRPTGGGPDYTMFTLDGQAVAGATPMSADMQAVGAPPVWVSYVKVDDIDAAAARAAEAGGVVFVPPLDVLDSGRMALVQDPTGAAFGLWSPRAFAGAGVVYEPNTLGWTELQTRDVATARTFYSQVFGWVGEGEAYVVFSQEGQPASGAVQMNEGWPPDAPSSWAVYFRVADIEATAARVGELGGAVLLGPEQAGDRGRFIAARDPQGAVFFAIQLPEEGGGARG